MIYLWEVVSDKYLFRINEDYTVEEISGIGLSKKKLKLFNGQSRNNNSNINRRSNRDNNMGKCR